MKSKKVFMAFAAGKQSTESAPIKRYIGMAPVYVLGVNPNKAELEAIYGRPQEKEPEYVSVIDNNGVQIKQARIDFIVATNQPGKDPVNPINMITKVSFFLRNTPYVGSASGKTQIIDKYGRTAWATQSDLSNKTIPVYKNGPANIAADYRVAYRGESELINFLTRYLNLDDVMVYNQNNGTWTMNDNPENSEASLEKIANYFNGDFSELRDICTLQPNNKVNCMFGVRTTDKGEFQTVYTNMFYKGGARNFDRIKKEYLESKNAGSYSDTEYDNCPLKEYSATATTFVQTPLAFNPFAAPSILNSEEPFPVDNSDPFANIQ